MRQTSLRLIPALFLVISLLSVSSPAAKQEKIGAMLQSLLAVTSPGEKIPVIVRMHKPLAVQTIAIPSRVTGHSRAQERSKLIHALKAHATIQRQPLEKRLHLQGITETRPLWLINGTALQATPEQIEDLSRMPEVEAISLDQVIELPEVLPAQASGPAEPNINLVTAPSLWARGYTGQGVTVAIMDTGADINHPDIGPRWRGGSNSWFDPYGEHPLVPTDRDGHGTQVTGLILGGNFSGAYIGVAPEAQWIAVKIFADGGAASSSAIHAGFQWLLDPDNNPDTDDAPDIVNNSWGFEASANICDTLSREFQVDVQTLQAAGMTVLFAAGNTGPATSSSIAPANYPESFAVGSVGTFTSPTQISSFSARGPSACDGTIYPDMVAPGFQVWTSDLTAGGAFPSSYFLATGTSFSTPQVSGVMALLHSAFPDITASNLETALKQSATDLGTVGADHTYGYGLVNALAAFNYLAGLQNIEITDSINPENDQVVAFGSVLPGSSAAASVRVRNAGSVPLTLGSTDISAIREPFTIVSDACSTRTLSPGETCTIELRFAPSLPGSFSANLVILSDAVDKEKVTITLSGAGNTPPVAPQPLAPANGETVGTTATFSWLPAKDAEGDAVTQFLVYSPHADFSFMTTRQVETVPAALLGAGGLLLGALLAGLARRRDLAIGLVFVMLFMVMAACGGGGGGGDDSPATADAQSTTVSGLVSGTTYYWKMVARDSYGAETQSTIRTILVR